MTLRLNGRQIEVFSAVMRCGGASAASEFLHISQPAISKTLASMEEELGYALFVRTGRGLRPTAEALTLLPHVKRVLAEFDRLRSNATVIARGFTGTLSVGGNHTLISSLASVAAGAMRDRYPETCLRLSLTPADDVIESVLQQRIDVGLMYGPVASHQLEIEPVCSWHCACVFPAFHAFDSLDRVTVDDLRGEVILSYVEQSPTGRAIRRLFADSARPIEPAIAFGDTFNLLQSVRSGMGVGLVDTFEYFGKLFPDLRSAPLVPLVKLDVAMVTRPESASNPAFAALLEEIRAAARTLGA